VQGDAGHPGKQSRGQENKYIIGKVGSRGEETLGVAEPPPPIAVANRFKPSNTFTERPMNKSCGTMHAGHSTHLSWGNLTVLVLKLAIFFI
jgi:hypothetical protein